MDPQTDIYAQFVDHPRYGQRPRFTGLQPVDGFFRRVNLGWNARPQEIIPETGIVAKQSRQSNAIDPVTHYVDLKRVCVNCKRSFIFFADEQRFWYETLQFDLNSDCVRCIDCRVAQRNIARFRDRYETLVVRNNRSDTETLELANTAKFLIDHGVFGHRCIERVRSFLKAIHEDSDVRQHVTFRDVDDWSAACLRAD